MRRVLFLVLIAVLIGAVLFGVWQFTESQRLTRENAALKQQHDEIARQLVTAQTELDAVRQELNATNMRIKELDANITRLQQQLEDKALQNGAITIGLSFLWASPMDHSGMEGFMHRLNEAWDRIDIYFFVYRNEVWPSLSLVDYHALNAGQACPKAIWDLHARAQKLYPRNDIPIFVVPSFGAYDGFCCWGHSDSQILISAMNVETLSHELLHSFGLHTEEAVETTLVCASYDCVLQPSASIQFLIQAAARQYQMPIPPDDS
jgi:hypothetical protein